MKRVNLTEHQLKLWLECKKNSATSYYDISLQYKITGAIDVSRLNLALESTVNSFEGLRTYFEEEQGFPGQIILERLYVEFNVIDCHEKEDLERKIEFIISSKIDIDQPPNNNYFFLKSSETSGILIFRFHHIIIDDYSIALFLNCFSRFYNEPSWFLPKEHTGSIDEYLVFIKEERSLVIESFRSYWDEKLRGATFQVDFLLGKKEPEWAPGRRYFFDIPQETYQALKNITVSNKSTFFNVMAALFKIIVYLYFSASDAVLAYSANIRPRDKRFESIFGYFVNMMLLSLPLTDDMSFLEILSSITSQRKEENKCRDYPIINHAMSILREKDGEIKKPFSILLAETHFSADFLLNDIFIEKRLSKFDDAIADLGLYYSQDNDELKLAFEYKTNVFSADFIENFSQNFVFLIDNVIKHQDKSISSLNFISKFQRTLINSWNNTEKKYTEKTIHQLFEEQVVNDPEAVALVFNDKKMTYDELNTRANQIAHYLSEQGIGSESDMLVGLGLERSFEMIIGVLAILKAGGAYVPLDPTHPDDRLSYMLKDTKVKFVLTQSHLLPRWRNLSNDKCFFIALALDNREIYQDLPTKNLDYISPNCLAYVLYTSGSTGKPKGVMITHRSVINLLFSMQETLNVSSEDRFLALTSMNFDIAGLEWYLSLSTRATLIVASQQQLNNIYDLIDLLEKYNPTVIQATPARWRMLLEAKWRASYSIKILIGGEALNADLAIKLLRQSHNVWNVYGPTETTIWSSCAKLENNTQLSIGRPLANTFFYILDKRKKIVPIGVEGELYISGIGLARGYLGRSDLTEDRFIWHKFDEDSEPIRLYKTGDLVRYLSDGNLEYVGRIDHQIKLNGFRIELGEIESQILKEADISNAVVLARKENKQLIAYIVSSRYFDQVIQDQQCFIENLRSNLSRFLPEYMMPAHFQLLDSLPITVNGKVDRNALECMPIIPTILANQAEYVAPSNELEQAILQVWQSVLGMERIGVNVKFSKLGGDSHQKLQVVLRLNQEGHLCTIRDIYDYETIADLAICLKSKASTAEERGDLNGGFGLLPIQHSILEKAHYTESDFNAVSLTQDFLNQLQSQDDSIEAIYPANSLQRGFIFHAISQPEDDAYRLQFLYDYEGEINIALYQEAWRLTILKFPILRAYFNWDREFIQIVTRKSNLTFCFQDIREAQDKEKALRQIQKHDRQQAFDLQRPTLLRVYLMQRSDQAFTLLKSTHHSIEDGWSNQIVLKTVHEYYLSLLKGQQPVVIEDMSYLNAQAYISYHQKFIQKQWRTHLESISEANDINSLLSRPADLNKVKTVNDPKAAFITIDGDRYERLKALSRSEGITLHEICQFAWSKILQTYTQDEYTVVGTTVSGRSLPIVGTENSAGLYINTVPLVVRWHKEGSVLDQLLQIKENMQFINEHSFVDLASLQITGKKLFHTLLVFENYPIQKSTPAGSMFKMNFRETIEKVDYQLSLVILESRGSLVICLNYDATYLEKSKAEKFLLEFKRICEQLPQKLKQKHTEVTLLNDRERYQQLIEWNQTEKTYTHATIHQLFEAQVIKTPENIALIFENAIMTYNELNFRSNKIAHYLREKGIGKTPDMLVGIGVNRSFEMIIGILAILKAGGAYVPMEPDYPDDRLSYMIEDTKIQLLLAQESVVDRWKRINFTGCVEILCIDNISLFDDYSSENSAITTLPQHLAYIIYTSGSTGTPKGVMLNHEGIVNRIEWMQAEYLLTSSDSVLQKTPFIFDVSVWELFWANWYGARIVIAKPEGHKDPEYMEQLISEQNITIMHFVPSMLSAFTANLSSRGRFLHKSLRYIFCSGEALFSNQFHELMLLSEDKKVRVENLYGPTEASIDVTYYACIEQSETLIGKPISNIQLYILGKNLELLPIGAVGELYIAGIGLARGYLNQETLTAERFIWHQFYAKHEQIRLYKTGDLVRYLPDGNIAYIGRADSQIKLRGFRVELGEIEAIIARQAYIAKVAVLVKGSAENQYLVAFIEIKQPDKTMMLAKYQLIKSLKKELAKYLPIHMLPSQIVLLSEISIGSTGKINRKALADFPISNNENIQHVLPRTFLEEKLANIWRQVLKREAVGVFDDFNSLGGNSITAVQLISLGLAQGVTLSLAQLFENPTIAELAKLAVENVDLLNAVSVKKTEEIPMTEKIFYPLTSMQNIIAKNYGHNKENDAIYHLQMSYLLEDITCSVECFKEAVRLMVTRHPIFRAAFRKTENCYEQFLREEVFFSINEMDISCLPVDQQNQYIDEFLRKDRLNPFLIDNQDEVFFRFNVFILNKRQIEFVFIAHHVIADGWGLILFMKELLSSYLLLKDKKVPVMFVVPNAHRFYVFHEINTVKSEAHKNFWISYLQDVFYNPPVFIEPASLDDNSTLCFKLDENIYHFAVGLSQDLRVSLKSVFLSFYFDVIKDISSSPESRLTVGVVANGGRIPEISGSLDSLGLFWNILPISLHYQPDKIRHIKQVHAHLSQVHSYSSYPLSVILENQGSDSLFFSTYNFVQFDDIGNFTDELKIKQTRVYDKFHYPINFFVNIDTQRSEVSCRIDYDRAVFSYEQILLLSRKLQENLIESYRSQFEGFSVFSFFGDLSDSGPCNKISELETCFDI